MEGDDKPLDDLKREVQEQRRQILELKDEVRELRERLATKAG